MAESARPDIIFVHSSLKRGGAEALRQSILPELQRRGVLFRICLLRDRGEFAEALGPDISVDFLGIRGHLFDFPGIYKLSRYLKTHEPLIVESSQFLTNYQSVVASKIAGIPIIVVEEHGLYSWKRWYHRLIDRWVTSHADRVIACSYAVRGFAQTIMGRHAPPIDVIHNCAAESHLIDKPSDPRSDLRYSFPKDSSFVVGIVATLRWEKDHATLLKAWSLVTLGNDLPEKAALLIVGDGPLEGALRTMAQDMPDVYFLGDRSDTPQLLRSLDLFVLPSVSEGFGIAIVEAMHAGLPVVATDVGGIPEIIEDGVTGFLVKPKDAEELAQVIARLANDDDLRHNIGHAAKHKANQSFTPRQYVEQLMEIYSELISFKGRPLPSWCVPPEHRDSQFPEKQR